MKQKNRKKIGLALGGGGAKGLAHIGVIKVFEKYGIPIDFIAGTSMGALVGGWYAANKDISLLESLFLEIDADEVVPIKKLLKEKKGILFTDKFVLKGIEKGFKNKEIEDCQIPFKAVATDLMTGDEVIMGSGDLDDAVRASIALPVIFKPIRSDGKVLVDGGLVNPVPADVVRQMGAEVVIAVDVSSKWIDIPEDISSLRDLYSIIPQVFSAAEYQIARKVLKQADVVLRPPVLNFNWLSFERAKEIIQRGFDEARSNLSLIEEKGCYQRKLPESFWEKLWDFTAYGD